MDISVPEQKTPRTNWAGNLTYGAERIVAPKTVAEAQEIVRATKKLRVLGTRHCFNNIADTPGTQVSLEHLRKIVSIDRAKSRVIVEGGTRYSDLMPALHAAGYAMHNTASLPHISIAGASATSTHGSGNVGSLATAISGIEFINGSGDLVALSRDKDGDTFAGAVVNLGALGVVTQMTIDVEPAFNARQDLYQDLPVREMEAHFDEIMGGGYSVSLFTDWLDDTVEQVWIKTKGEKFAHGDTFFGARRATRKLHPIEALDATHCTDQLGTIGTWWERIPHFKIGSTPASGEDVQVEYFIPREHAVAALKVMGKWGERLKPVLMIGEVRTIAADDLWMSPFYKQPCMALHFSTYQNWPALREVLVGLEADLARFNMRPHWGKLFAMSPKALQSHYERLPDFRDLLNQHDPQGKFRNAYVDKYVFGR